MEDDSISFEVLKKYAEYLESQAEVIRSIRLNKKSLENSIEGYPDIQKCANEIEAQMDPRSAYLHEYVETLVKSTKLDESQKKDLEDIRVKIYKYCDEFSDPLVKVKYSPFD